LYLLHSVLNLTTTVNRRAASAESRAGPGLGYISNMDRARIKPDLPVLVLLALMATALGGLLLLPPIPQDQGYH
jgi:hypothetical protein